MGMKFLQGDPRACNGSARSAQDAASGGEIQYARGAATPDQPPGEPAGASNPSTKMRSITVTV
ncbi:MAG: hypothetical protein ABW187_07830, partial [Dokdonella sp.]